MKTVLEGRTKEFAVRVVRLIRTFPLSAFALSAFSTTFSLSRSLLSAFHITQ